MGFIIEDGKGKGYAAEVDDKNKLVVSATTYEAEESAAFDGNSFILHGQCHLAAAASGAFMYFKNTSTNYNYYISRVYIDAQNLTTNVYVTQQKEPTPTNGTDVSSTGIVQKNFGSGATLTGTLKISDGSSDMTLASGTTYHSFTVQSQQSYLRDMKGTNVITPNTAIGWGWTTVGGGNATNAEIVSFSVNIYRKKI